MSNEPVPASARVLRIIYFVAGCVLVAVGIAGYFLPVMPGTIFLILAAACFARSSPRFEAWLVNHPKFGPSVVAWRKHGAIPTRIKVIAIGAMAISFAIMIAAHAPAIAMWIAGLALGASALFVGTRPGGPRAGAE
jgi:uncharacterized membrane protein YbaN (DUF454 family)